MILFYLLVTVMPMMRHPLWSDLIGDLTVIKYLGLACAIYTLVYIAASRSAPPDLLGTWQGRWFLLFVLVGMASFLTLGVPQPLEVSPLMSLVSFLLFFFVTLALVNSLSRLRWTILVAVGSVAYASLHILREWQKYGGMSFGYRPGWVTGDPNYYSASALLCLPLTYYLLRTKQVWWERWFCASSLVLTVAALTLAGSRGALFGLIAAATVIVWRAEHRHRTAIIAGAVLLPLMLLTPASPLDRLLNPTRGDLQSSDIRQALWSAGLRMVRENPVTGIGLGNFKPLVDRFAGPDEDLHFIAHNTYVEVGAELGIPGFLLFMAIVASTFLSLGRVRRATAADKSSLPHQVAQGMQSGLVAFLVSGFFMSAQYQKLFWLFVFLSAVLHALIRVPPSLEGRRLLPEPAYPGRRPPGGVRPGPASALAVLSLLTLACPAIASASEPPRSADSGDQFGGLPVRVSEPAAVFRVTKVGQRWIFVTPEGNGFWLRGVYVIGWGDGGQIAHETFKTKYKGDQVAFATHALQMLRAWGFNAIGPYSSMYAMPVPTDLRKEGNPEKMPFIRVVNASWYGATNEKDLAVAKWHLAPAPFKTLLAGAVDGTVYKGWPGHTPDVFDPNFETAVRNLTGDVRTQSRATSVTGWDPQKNTWVTTTGGTPHPVLSKTPWLIGTTSDDSDFLFGFGPGPEVPGVNGVIHPHIGWIVAVTRPEQKSNPSVGAAFGLKQTVTYADSVVYAKRAWRDYLATKYRTIESLNAAWGSTYTTFDSRGGWPGGSGLLDENGRNRWIGADAEKLTGAAPAVRADLDAFLEIFADRYFKVVTAAARAATPDHLVFSPAMLNGHKGLTRREILRAAGRYCDVIEVNQNPTKPELIGITYAETGGKPMVSWMGHTANPDSALRAYRFELGTSAPTQAERAARYERDLNVLVNTPARDGSYPMVGFVWWEYMDKWGEKANWGLVSPRNNAYDGKAAVRAPGTDAWGYPTGGEDGDYGDFISGVSRANQALDRYLLGEIGQAKGPSTPAAPEWLKTR